MDKLLIEQTKALLEEEDMIAALANVSSAIMQQVSVINWVGFYFLKNDELVLGPFQGKPACTHIKLNAGVCGKCASTKQVQRIDDVHQFPGHIACDVESNSELVVPIIIDNQVWGLLDIDAPTTKRFSQEDQDTMVDIVNNIQKEIKNKSW